MNHAVNWEAISAIGQLVGALAVVISLLYLAREVRSSAHATRVASMHSLSDKFNRWSQQLAEQPHLSELYYRGIHDFESLEGTDLIRFFSLMHGAFRNHEEIYHLQAKAIWKKTCGVGGKRSYETSMHIPEFRLGGVHARIGLARSL